VALFEQNVGIWFRIARTLLRSGQNRKKNSNRQIENRSSPYFFVFLMQFVLQASGGFHIVSDTLVIKYIYIAQDHEKAENALFSPVVLMSLQVSQWS